MLTIVEPAENLIDILYDTVTSGGGKDYSDTLVVFPSRRIGVFLEDRFTDSIEGVFLPPSMLTNDQFVSDLFIHNFPGFRAAEGPEASIMIYRAIKKKNFKNSYTGYREGADFASFHPWGKELVRVVEELLVEGADLNVSSEIYERFVELGDYHLEYKDFIALLPELVKEYVNIMTENRLFTRGISYRRVAELAEEGKLELRTHKRLILAGVNAFNRCEEKLFAYIPDKLDLSVVVKSEAALLKSGEWPYYYQKKALGKVGVKIPAYNETVVEDSYDNVDIVPVTNRETGMVVLFNYLKKELENCSDGKRVGIVMTDPGALLPFIQGVIARFTEEESSRIAFNISMGYPMGRTPVFQLIRLMLRMESRKLISASDYLNLMRHPYVKLSAEDQDSCRTAVWTLSKLIVDNDISGIDPEEIITFTEKHLKEREIDNVEGVVATIRELHRKFFVTETGSSEQILGAVRNVVEGLKKNAGGYLLLNEYVNTALEVIDHFLTFRYPEIIQENPAKEVLGIFLRDLEAAKVQFHGTPVMGVQVMGMLEFRGLSFDKLFVLDAVEGVLPESFKYDPLLPSDIRKVFNIRSFADLEQLYAYNFFTIIKSAGKATIFYPENQKGDGVRSRYIEKILFEKEKHKKPFSKVEINVPFRVNTGKLRSVEKRDEHLQGLKFSPSMVEEYIACPLRFYYKNIVNLRPERTVSDVMESDIVGVMIHEMMEEIYGNFTYGDIKPEIVEQMLRDKWTGGIRKEGIKNIRVSGFEPDKGTGRIRFRTIAKKLYEYLILDMRRVKNEGIYIKGHEVPFDFKERTGNRDIHFKGRVDRLEKEGDIYRILDYKTGASFVAQNSAAAIDSFDPSEISAGNSDISLGALRQCEKIFRNFQILMYSKFCRHKYNLDSDKVDGAYAFILEPGKYFMQVYKNRGKEDDVHKEKVIELFEQTLEKVIEDIFTRELFLPNPTTAHCKYCHFRISCRNN